MSPHFCRTLAIRTALAVLLCAAPVVANAAPILTGLVTVTFQESGFSDVTDVVLIGAGPEIVAGPLTNIGSEIMLDGEFIDIGSQTIALRMFGGGGATGTPGFLDLGFNADANYDFSNILFDVPGRIIGVTFVPNPLISNFGSGDLSFTDNSISVHIGELGIATASLNNPSNLGLLTLNVQTQATEVTAVPEPASISLLGLGLAAAWRTRARRSRGSKGRAQ